MWYIKVAAQTAVYQWIISSALESPEDDSDKVKILEKPWWHYYNVRYKTIQTDNGT